MSEEHIPYDLHPDGDTDGDPPAPPRDEARPDAAAGKPPIDLEPDERPHPRPGPTPRTEESAAIKALDVCPNCGAPMPDIKTIVCLRCGFDIKKLKVIKTATGETEQEEEEEERRPPPVCRPGTGDIWLPAAIAGAAGAILLVGYLAGAAGLFPSVPAAEAAAGQAADAGDRFLRLLRAVVLIAMWSTCGLGGLAFVAHLLETRLGDVRLAIVRVVAIITAMRLATFLSLGSPSLEWTVEAVLQAAVFFGLTVVLFRLTPRDAAIGGAAALFSFVLLWIGAVAIVWATG